MAAGKNFKYAAFYDLDYTILEDNSATHLVREARARGVMKERFFRHAVLLSILYKLGIGNSTKMITRMLGWMKGLEVEPTRQLCLEIFNKHIKQKIRPEILESIREHKVAGGSVILLSSATDPICGPVYEHLEMDDLICSILGEKDGRFTGTTSGKLVYDKEKEVRLLQYCEEHGFDPKTAWYYGDSFTDEHVMKAVGNPVAVDPDRKLLRIARKENWTITLRTRS